MKHDQTPGFQNYKIGSGQESKMAAITKNSKNKRAMMALGRSPGYHWNQIISKSVHWFSKSRLKLFSIYSPGAILFNRAEWFEQFW